ncbi:MAG: hypothetical protein JNG88_16885 [Phycisphaerales bacterium]|nr:hypothetical protein [Phycisphaerales bacterium]
MSPISLSPYIHALCVYNDGNGPALYAGGDFLMVGNERFNSIAKWDGVAWRPLQTGLGGGCFVLKVYDDGTGPALFAGGPFSRAGDQTAWSVAKWDGQQWHGFGGTDGIYVYALEVWDDDGDGPRRPGLYVGGQFDFAVQPTGEWIPAENMARWDGQTWEAVGAGTPGTIRALKVHDDGTGAKLYAAGGMEVNNGQPMRQVGFWDGQTWNVLDGAFDGGGSSGTQVYALESYDDGHGPQLYAGGTFDFVNGTVAQNIARWDGQQFHSLAHGQGLVGQNPWTMAAFDDGRRPAIYAAGYIDAAGDVPIDGLARWDGQGWENTSTTGAILYLASHNDADGQHLYATGGISRIAGVEVDKLARFDGQHWEPVGATQFDNGGVPATLEFFDDSGGEALYIGGQFRTLGGQTFNNVARWNGQQWQPLGAGFTNPSGQTIVTDLQVYDDGNGPALYACGWFRDSGTTRVNGIARWDGQQWQPLGSGLTYGTAVHPYPYAMAVHDDGGGPQLYVAGQFNRAGGQPAPSLARWDGQTWSTFGNITFTDSTPPVVDSLLSFDIGDGLGLFIGANALRVNGVQLRGLLRWKDGQLAEFAGGMHSGNPFVLLGRHEAGGPALYAAGAFSTVGPADAPIVSARFARYGCVTTVNRGDLNCDGLVNAYDIDAFVLAMQDAARYAETYPDCRIQNADTNADGAVNAFDIDPFVALLVGA